MTTIRVVEGDTGTAFVFRLEDDLTQEAVDLTDPTTTVAFAVQLEYGGVPRTSNIAMEKVSGGADGEVRLPWAGGELVGADDGDFTGEIRITEGGEVVTVFETIRVRVRARGGGQWDASQG